MLRRRMPVEPQLEQEVRRDAAPAPDAVRAQMKSSRQCSVAAKMLDDLGLLNTAIGRYAVSTAVINDVMALFILGSVEFQVGCRA